MAKKVLLKARKNAAPGYAGFVGWLAATHPDLYARVEATDPRTVLGLRNRQNPAQTLMGDETAAPSKTALQQFVDTVVSAGAAVLPLVQQQKVLKMQLERAKQGLPPLDVGSYIDPNAGLNVGINPGTQKTLLWLGGGIVGAFLLSRIFGRR